MEKNKHTQNNQQNKNPFPAMEEEVLNFWDKNKIFEKSVTSPPAPLLGKERGVKEYVFYDGPPFATGTPHYGHVVASIMKDVVPRYWTMKGFKVERKWGWDCHGLPIENIVEKELGFKSKKDIEELGIEKFNKTCRSKVLTYVDEWKKVIRRLGRWADMENAYKTMDLDYMESVWHVFSQLYKKGLIYEGYKSMHICPRCETTLSQMEVAEGYKTVKDLSAVVKFKLVDEPGTYVLAWTTTPWTLIGNVALAINDKETYVKLKITKINYSNKINAKEGEIYILLESAISRVFGTPLGWSETSGLTGSASINNENFSASFDVLERPVKIKNLVGKKYKQLFPEFIEAFRQRRSDGGLPDPNKIGAEIKQPMAKLIKNTAPEYITEAPEEEKFLNAFKIYSAKFVNTEEGTGIVHIAPGFGEDDLNLSKEYNLPVIQHVKMDGKFIDSVWSTFQDADSHWAEWTVKPKETPQATDVEIIKYLARKNLLFSKEKYEHSYPHCWRCDTPLLNYATSSWFVKVTDIKDKALKLAKEINWTPKHIKEGRFGNWLEGARDWSISRQRFWASVIPIWKCALTPNPSPKGRGETCDEIKVIGSVAELEELSGEKINDLHKHIVDKITFPCEKCGGTMKRIPDVLDCWFESGSMPYAQMHYPFENEKKFEENFPAEFIAEGTDQTRAWFYYLHIIATAIKNKPAFKNVIVNGIVLAEDGKKMAKRLQNYPDPMEIMEKHGADKLRYYLCSASVMKAEDLNFSEKDLVEQTRFFNVLLNVLTFYKMFAPSPLTPLPEGEGKNSNKVGDLIKEDLVNVLDKWITARLEETKKIVTEKMDNYDLHAIREIPVFIDDLSTWYIRRSRDRFKSEDEQDKNNALMTTKFILESLAKVMAPYTPFIAETIWQKVTGNNFKDANKSVHLESWPTIVNNEKTMENRILEEMETVRKIVELGLAKRDEMGIKVRQPLSELRITNYELRNEYEDLIKDELNVKSVKAKKGEGELSVGLDTKITPELKQEGVKRELVRAINNARKNTGLTIQDRAMIYYQTDSKDIKQAFETFSEDIKKDTLSDEIKIGAGDVVKINGEEVELKVEKK